MSAVQTLSGAEAAKLRSTRSGAAGAARSSLRVVRFLRPRMQLKDPLFAHQSCNPLPGAAHSQSPELGMDAWVAMDLAAHVMDLSDLLGECSAFSRSLLEGERSFQP
jgi:hypothetical protein